MYDRRVFLVFVVLFGFIYMLPMATWADENEQLSSEEILAEGGKLYDKWWQVYGLKPPKNTHPAYPAGSKKTGAATWRCKECHGWDYRGKDGAYAKGSHSTGIKGISAYRGKSPKKIMSILKDKNHQYGSVMLDQILGYIALFVSQGQVSMNDYIDAATKKSKGEAIAGRAVFLDKCSRCHGEEGNDFNFGDEVEPEYVGTVAAHNPWEALHKILNGHPGSHMNHNIIHSKYEISRRHHQGLIKPWEPMPAFRKALSEKGIRDLLAYSQTLPVE